MRVNILSFNILSMTANKGKVNLTFNLFDSRGYKIMDEFILCYVVIFMGFV